MPPFLASLFLTTSLSSGGGPPAPSLGASPGIVGTADTFSTGTAHPINLGSFVAGDLLVVMGDKYNNGGLSAITPGWTIAQQISFLSGDRTFIVWKEATGGDVLTLTWGASTTIGVRCFVIRGHAPGVAPISTGVAGGDMGAMTMPGSNLQNNGLCLVVGTGNPGTPTSVPTGYTEQGTAQRSRFGSKAMSSAASENPPAFGGTTYGAGGLLISSPNVLIAAGVGKYAVGYNGSEKSFTVGPGVTGMRLKVWGGGGGGGYYVGGRYGGGGGYAFAEVPVTPGQKITLQVAQGGNPGAAVKAYPDGGPGSYGDTTGGGGGGSSRVWIDEVITVVAGGGGASAGYGGWGGLGGGESGGGSNGPGGTQTASGYVGGAAGLFTYAGDPTGEGGGNYRNGRLAALTWAGRNWQRGGYGGPQGAGTGDDGGGGGGGFYGGAGGGGDGNGGGAGSGHFKPGKVVLGSFIQGVHNGAANSSDPDYPGGNVAFGPVSSSGTPGGNGHIVVEFVASGIDSPTLADDAFNPVGAGPGLTFTNTNHTISRNISGNDSPTNGALSLRSRNGGRVYFEATMLKDGNGYSGTFGFLDDGTTVASVVPQSNYLSGLQVTPANLSNMSIRRAGVSTSIAGSYPSGVVVGFAIDFDEGKAWVRLNGDWISSTDTKVGSFNAADPTYTFTPGQASRIIGESYFSSTAITLNTFGPFARAMPPDFDGW